MLLQQFRKTVYQCLRKRADAFLDLLDALTTAGHVNSPVALSEETPYRRKFSSVFDTLQHAEFDELLAALYEFQPPDSGKIAGYEVYGLDSTPNERSEAETLEDRGSLKTHKDEPVRYGHKYSWLTRLIQWGTSWVAATHAHLVFIERSTEMLNWRFIRNPWYAYQAFLVCQDGAPVGWLVLKEFTDPTSGQRYGDIVDLVWSPSGAAHLPEILSFANRTFFNAGIPDSTIWLDTHTELDQVGVDYGYQPLGGGRYFACKTLSESFSPLLEPSTLFQTPYDTDLY